MRGVSENGQSARLRGLVHFSKVLMKPASRPPRPRGLFIAALLLLTLALAGAIALQAYRTFLGHKATAERVLRDYARIAAGRFVQRANMNVYYSAFYPVQDALSRAKAGQPEMPLPAPGHLPAGSEHHTADFRTLARYTFRYDLKSGRLETAGETPSAAARRWLLDTLPVHSRTVYEPKERVASIVRSVDGVPRAIVYTVVMDKAGAPRLVLGLEEDPRGFEGLYAAEADRFPLLPRPLTGGVVDDSLGSAVVTGADGVELYRSPVQYAPTFAARDSMEPILGGMRVQIALRPDFAPTLVIGGMPRSNLPMLLSLLALTAGLVVAALLQLARENEPTSCPACRTSCARPSRRSGCFPRRCCSAACAPTGSGCAHSRSSTRKRAASRTWFKTCCISHAPSARSRGYHWQRRRSPRWYVRP